MRVYSERKLMTDETKPTPATGAPTTPAPTAAVDTKPADQKPAAPVVK